MQAIKSPDMETIRSCRTVDAMLMDRRILVPQARASQISTRPLNSPLPRKVVAMPNTTPERRAKESLWFTLSSLCFSMALA